LLLYGKYAQNKAANLLRITLTAKKTKPQLLLIKINRTNKAKNIVRNIFLAIENKKRTAGAVLFVCIFIF